MRRDLASIDLNLLLLLEALYDERHLTRAAARLGVGQPSASKALDRLRAVLGDKLFVRIPGGMRPTRRALEIEPGIRRALSEIRGALLSAEDFDPAQAVGTVRLATSDIVTLTFMPPIVAALHAKAPGVELRIRNLEKETAFPDLDAGRIDFVIGVFDDLPKRFMARTVIEDRFAVIAPKGFAGTRLTLDAYLAVPHILFTLRDDAQGAVDAALAELGRTRRVALTVNHVLAVPALVAQTGFISTISIQIANRLAPLEDCQILELPLAIKPWAQKLIWSREANDNKLLKLVLDEVLKAAGASVDKRKSGGAN
jgi:DNA-binding transcriptional LysR family regulator